jgi:hypothetical protein
LNIIHIGRHAGAATALKSNTGLGKVHNEIVSRRSSLTNRLRSRTPQRTFVLLIIITCSQPLTSPF